MKPSLGWLAATAAGAALVAMLAADPLPADDAANTPPIPATNMQPKIVKTDTEWKETLTPEQYRVLRQKGTETAFSGAYWNQHEPGTYRCAGCGAMLFSSDAKFDSGCGWPSFFRPAATNVVAEASDRSHGLARTEVLCSRCGGHLGHVFDDGPKPTGQRYCINSAALKLETRPAPK
jgi:peptide-methionine (R)-S-oxide reductase